MSLAAEKDGLAEPFKGIAAKGDIEPNLFGIRSTGVSTEPVRAAAAAFLASLSAEQRRATAFPIDADEWRKWMNQSFYVRQGVSFRDMTGLQREAAFALLRAGLSAKGLKLTRDKRGTHSCLCTGVPTPEAPRTSRYFQPALINPITSRCYVH